MCYMQSISHYPFQMTINVAMITTTTTTTGVLLASKVNETVVTHSKSINWGDQMINTNL